MVTLGAGVSHTIFVDTTGDFYVCGDNSFGQLGIGQTTRQLSLAKVVYPFTTKLKLKGKKTKSARNTVEQF